MRNTIETDVESFWKLIFDLDFSRALIADFGNLELLEQGTDPDGIYHRRVHYIPKLDMPAMVKKLFGDGSYTEIGRFDPAAKTYFAQSVPNFGADRFKSSFEVSAEPLADKRCERVLVFDNDVRFFGLGAAIEALVERTQREVQAKAVAFTNTWIREKGL